jgi:hypothetical protein
MSPRGSGCCSHVTSSEKLLLSLYQKMSNSSYIPLTPSQKPFTFALQNLLLSEITRLLAGLLSSTKCKLQKSRVLPFAPYIHHAHRSLDEQEIMIHMFYKTCFEKQTSCFDECAIIPFLTAWPHLLSFTWKVVHLLLIKHHHPLSPVQLPHHLGRLPWLLRLG